MIDEMDLLKTMKDAEPVRPQALEDARAVLRAAIAADGPVAARRRARWGVRRTVGLGAAAVAAAAAAALVVSSASTPGTPPAAVVAAPEGNPVLTRLVADITALPAEASGDATLEIRNQSPTSTALGDNGIGLFTDDGTYYWGNDKAALRRVVTRREGGDDLFKRSIAVALYAVKGDIATARERMAVANLAPGVDPAKDDARTEKLKALAKARGEKYVPPAPPSAEEQKEVTDNHIWTNAVDALIAAPDNPQVRAGVLRIMATMPKVKVTETTTAGRPTLTLTDSWSTAGDTVATLIIDAATGQPVAMSTSSSDAPSRTLYYHNTRVTLADIEAGRF